MEYLKKSFTVAVTDRRYRPGTFLDLERNATRRAKAKEKHEFENGGVMCQLCGMGDQAPIHKVFATYADIERRDDYGVQSTIEAHHKAVRRA